MALQSISLHNVRSYDLSTVALDESVTLVLGRNGSGKTTLLEAVYLLLRGTSFRARDRDIIAHDQDAAEIKLITSDGERRVRLRIEPDEKISKQFTIDAKTTARLPAKFRHPVVLFEPDELRLLSSSPQRRRQFFDDVLSRLYPAYATSLSRYQRTLMQRNELLKQRETMNEQSWENHLFAWDVKFSELAEALVTKRQEFLSLSSDRLGHLYSEMANAPHVVGVTYSQPTHENYQQALLKKLQSSRLADSYRGYTSTGPHRDDFHISLDGHPVQETASRGEMRTIMLAYKLLEVTLQEELTGQRPIILMDDVFSELDITREKHLMHSLQGYQTIITATDLRDELKIDASIITLAG
jgi:DNA replication and repair protein RecF